MDSLQKDLKKKRDAYARAGIPCYWVFDAERYGLRIFSHPEGGIYRQESFVAEGENVEIPYLGDTLDFRKVFSTAT